MISWRCRLCNKLLAKLSMLGYVEIKCTRCGTLNRKKATSLPDELSNGDSYEQTPSTLDRRQT